MAREPQYGVTLNGWERLLGSLEANAGDFPQLETYRAQLKTMLDAAREAATQQAALAAEKQETTQRLQSALAEGRKLANFLRNGVRQRYGNRSEKLVEFGLRPFRSRVRALLPVVKKPEPPATAPDKP
jgi:paraquat-inducible protein B